MNALHRCAAAALALAACSNHTAAPGGSVGIAWAAPATNADGTPLRDLAGFKLHFGPASRGDNAAYAYPRVVDVGLVACNPECTYDVQLDPGTTYLAVTAYDTATPPNESAYSNELVVTR